MIHSEQYYKDVIENYRKQVAQLKKENETKDNEVKILKKQNKEKDEVIHDLDKKDYRGQCEALKEENKELKKKLKKYEEKFELARISLEKNSSNSCKPSSTNGYKKVIQNNREKTGRKPGREEGSSFICSLINLSRILLNTGISLNAHSMLFFPCSAKLISLISHFISIAVTIFTFLIFHKLNLLLNFHYLYVQLPNEADFQYFAS